MQKITTLIRQHRIYFAGLFVTLVSGLLFLLLNGKAASFISLSSYHPFYLNVFFINYTFMGDGIFAICLIAMMFFYYKRKQCGFALLYSFLISGFIAQLVKNLVNAPRPKLYFEAGTYLNFIDGVTLHAGHSFPSGHTATAFAIATVLVLMLRNKKLQLLILAAAILVGYSRIYLAQHFLADVLVGAVLGTISALPAFYLAHNRLSIKRSFKKMHQVPNTTAAPAMQTA